ncbi:putative MFS family arabinose efflux permease [Rhodobacter viridis]|uniref:Putative MFS family arabinose efflux permease n=1 Tax=Rhodobacter viridis TaxID=1054202 RepID=A0A318TXK5_9RHOB|nr:MFS transporter [Rhodobacter viridis]PYF09716.1 putative MFS family arabinose efflux permease [Rhodobacter viridis]
MRLSIAFLVAGYVLSQFYRACLAVLTPVLKTELGATAEDLAVSLGLWYLAFALMQIPVGEALDRIGPRRTVGWVLALAGGGGAATFALATGPWGIHLAMVLIGIGCAPVLMGAYFIFARSFPMSRFGTLAALAVGVGSLGNLAGAAPLAWAIAHLGWRATLWGLTGLTLAVALGVLIFTRDPERIVRQGQKASALDILRLPGFWMILPLIFTSYAAPAAFRGLWAGPWLGAMQGADAALIGRVTLVMGAMMVLGNFLCGPAERVAGSSKRVAVLGNAGLCLCLGGLALHPDAGLWTGTLLLAAVGFFGATYPALMSHGRTFLPPHLVGRGVTLLNLFSIAGAGIGLFLSRPVFAAASSTGDPVAAYRTLFLFFLVPLLAGLGIYLFARSRPA